MAVVFRPPTVTESVVLDRVTGLRINVDRGVSVLKESGAYRQVRTPSQVEVDAADVAYIGGHEYHIDTTEQAALTAAGYGAYITDDGGF